MKTDDLMKLHELLGEFEMYRALGYFPPNWDAIECMQSRDLQQDIEDIVSQRQKEEKATKKDPPIIP